MTDEDFAKLKETALQLFEQQKYTDLHECLLQLVDRDEPWGLHYLAGLYSLGFGVSVDQHKANQLYLRAANLGFKDSQAVIGNNLCGGFGCEKDVSSGIFWLKEASKQGHSYADFVLSTAYLNGLGVVRDLQSGIAYLTASAEAGFSQAQRKLAHLKLEGDIVQKDTGGGIQLLMEAANQSDREATYDLGKLYEKGLFVEQNFSEALKYLLLAAEGGHMPAMHDVGVLYFNGTGVGKSVDKARQWYLKAANLGSHLSSYCLGLNSEFGDGEKNERSLSLAITWYLISIAQAKGEFQEARARIEELKPALLERDLKNIVFFMTSMADERGFPWAQLALGGMYQRGEFVDHNPELSQKYFTLAAGGGCSHPKFTS